MEQWDNWEEREGLLAFDPVCAIIFLSMNFFKNIDFAVAEFMVDESGEYLIVKMYDKKKKEVLWKVNLSLYRMFHMVDDPFSGHFRWRLLDCRHRSLD